MGLISRSHLIHWDKCFERSLVGFFSLLIFTEWSCSENNSAALKETRNSPKTGSITIGLKGKQPLWGRGEKEKTPTPPRLRRFFSPRSSVSSLRPLTPSQRISAPISCSWKLMRLHQTQARSLALFPSRCHERFMRSSRQPYRQNTWKHLSQRQKEMMPGCFFFFFF